MSWTYSEQMLLANSKSFKSSRRIFLHCTSIRSDNDDVSQELHEQLVGQVIRKLSCCKVVLQMAHKIRNVFQEKINVLVSILHESDAICKGAPQSIKKRGTENGKMTRWLSEQPELCFHYFRRLKWSKINVINLFSEVAHNQVVQEVQSCQPIKILITLNFGSACRVQLLSKHYWKTRIKCSYPPFNTSEAQNHFYQGPFRPSSSSAFFSVIDVIS